MSSLDDIRWKQCVFICIWINGKNNKANCMSECILSRRMDAKHVDSSQPNLLGAIAPRRFGATNLLFIVHSPWHNIGPLSYSTKGDEIYERFVCFEKTNNPYLWMKTTLMLHYTWHGSLSTKQCSYRPRAFDMLVFSSSPLQTVYIRNKRAGQRFGVSHRMR